MVKKSERRTRRTHTPAFKAQVAVVGTVRIGNRAVGITYRRAWRGAQTA